MASYESDYAAARIIVSGGGGSGMGAALVAKLTAYGAEVHVLDLKPPAVDTGAIFHATDLVDGSAISAVVAEIGGPITHLFNCVGVPSSKTSNVDTVLINFVGVRHLTELVVPLIAPGGSVTTIASQAGSGWMRNVERWLPLVTSDGFDGGKAWLEEHSDDIGLAYVASKESAVIWTQYAAVALGTKGIRINCTMPGPTETPMTADFVEAKGKEFWDAFPIPLGRPATPDEQADVLVYLGSSAAACVTGSAVLTDGGTMGGVFTGQLSMPFTN